MDCRNLGNRELSRLEFFPEFFEVRRVFLRESLVANEKEVLVILHDCGLCPVERSCRDEFVIDDNIFMVHVSVLAEIRAEFNEVIAGTLQDVHNAVHACVLLVVGNNADFHVVFDDFVQNRHRNVLIGEREHTYLQFFLGFIDKVNDLLFVCFVWEKYDFTVHFRSFGMTAGLRWREERGVELTKWDFWRREAKEIVNYLAQFLIVFCKFVCLFVCCTQLS